MPTGWIIARPAAIEWARRALESTDPAVAVTITAKQALALGLAMSGRGREGIELLASGSASRIEPEPFELVHAVASLSYAARGDWSVAARHVEAAQRAAGQAPLPVSIYYASFASANLARARGEWQSVVTALRPLHDEAIGELMTNMGQVGWRLLEAEALLRTRREQAASAILGDLEPAGELIKVESCRLRGIVEQSRQRRARARAAFLEGQEAAESARSPIASGTLELAYGHFLRRTGNRRAATATLRHARERFEYLRARPLLEQCDAELAACGVRARAQRSSDGYGLTAREQVVARLVESGKSNREVAAELYLLRGSLAPAR